MHETESGPSFHNSHYTCDDTLKSVTNFSQTCSFLFIDAFFFSLVNWHMHIYNTFTDFFSFFFFLHVNQSHPDKNPNKPELHERFVQVNLVLLLD